MIYLEDSVVVDEIIQHISEQRARAKLTDKPFDLGMMHACLPSKKSGWRIIIGMMMHYGQNLG